MSEHTKLPWTIGPRRNVIAGPNGAIIIHCEFTDSDFSGKTKPSGPEAIANAAFIVTACNVHATLTQQRDELAEALRELTESAEDYGASPAGGNEMMSRFEDAISSARAAITKVKP